MAHENMNSSPVETSHRLMEIQQKGQALVRHQIQGLVDIIMEAAGIDTFDRFDEYCQEHKVRTPLQRDGQGSGDQGQSQECSLVAQ